MPRDMFGSVTDPPGLFGSKSRYSVPIAFLVHVAVIVPLVVIPLLATGVLPSPEKIDVFFVPSPTPPEPPRAPRPPDATQPIRVNPDAAPLVAQDGIQPEVPFEVVPFEGDTPDGVLETGIDKFETVLAAPPPPPQPPPQPVRVGVVRQPAKTRDVAPVYPPIARAAGISGVVIIEALIDIDGRVQQARVLRSIPLLDQAALEAVQQWQYTPTLLNGQPVPVLMTVTVQFILNR